MENKGFIVTKEHLTLLRNATVEWNPIEVGAPSINPKKPYGNSNVAEDIYELLYPEAYDALTKEEKEDFYDERDVKGYDYHSHFMKKHKETQKVLEIVLATGRFLPGIYEHDWRTEPNWSFKRFTDAYNDDLRKTIATCPTFIMLAGHLRRSYGLFNIKLEKYYSPETLITNALYYFMGQLNEVMIPVDQGFRDKVKELKSKEFSHF
jgi:hypothetical protein